MHQTCMDIFLCVCVCVCVSVDTHACIMGTMSVAQTVSSVYYVCVNGHMNLHMCP